MSDWTLIHDSKPVEVGTANDGQRMFARVRVYDKGHQDLLGRYVVAKTFRLRNGRIRCTQTDYWQRPAALNYAQHWLKVRSGIAAPKPAQEAL